MKVLDAKRRFTAAERRPHVAKLYKRGYSQSAIAEKFGVSQFTISKDIAKLEKQFKAEQAIIIVDRKMEMEMMIKETLAELWEQYELSKQDRKKVTTIKRRDGTVESVATITEKSIADPRWMQQIRGCYDQLAKLWHVNQPMQINVLQQEIIALLINGQVDIEEVRQDFPEIADKFFEQKGLLIDG